MSFYYLVCIEAERGSYEEVMQIVDKELVGNSHSVKAHGPRVYLFRKMGRTKQATREVAGNLAVDPFDCASRMERSYADGRQKESLLKKFNTLARSFHENYLMTIRDHAEFGAYKEAVMVLSQCDEAQPMLFYYKAYYLGKIGEDTSYTLLQVSQYSMDYYFPSGLEDILALGYVVRGKRGDANTYYYLDNLYYDKVQYDTAIGY